MCDYAMTYPEIDPPPDPPMASFSNYPFAVIEVVMAMLDVYTFFRGSMCSSVVLLLPFLPQPSPLICRECIQIVFRSILNKWNTNTPSTNA